MIDERPERKAKIIYTGDYYELVITEDYVPVDRIEKLPSQEAAFKAANKLGVPVVGLENKTLEDN